MAKFSLNHTEYALPASKADFTSLIEKLSAQHQGLREKSLLFFLRAQHSADPEYVASVVAEGKFGTLHLLFELLGRPDLSKAGFFERVISSAEIENLLSAFSPFMGDGQNHPNIDFLTRAKAQSAKVSVGILQHADADSKNRPDYVKYRTNLLFDLFNEGALRGADGVARQALLDSFSFLPNLYLSSEGPFVSGLGAAPIRSIAENQERADNAASFAMGGVDKFTSLMAVRGERLMRDGNRIIPSAMIRDGVHVGKRNIFMFHAAVNLASFIGDDNMIDSHASLASAAQVGNKNKIGSFVSIEGVLSPANAMPVYIGDENFLGTFVRIGTGIKLGNKNFIGAGVNLSKGTKIKDCREGSASRGEYLHVQDLNDNFNSLAIGPNNAVRQFNGVDLLPGEYILFDNSEEFMKRFEGDDRIKGKN